MILKTHIHDVIILYSIDNTDGTESTDTMGSIYNTDSIDYTDSADNTNSTDSKDSTYSTEYSGYIIQSIEHTVYTVLYGMYKVLTMYSDRYNVTGGQAPVAAQDLGRQWWTEETEKKSKIYFIQRSHYKFNTTHIKTQCKLGGCVVMPTVNYAI